MQPPRSVGGLICSRRADKPRICSVKIESINQDVTYNINGVSTTVTGTVYACQTANKAAFSGGDSGGPVETTAWQHLGERPRGDPGKHG